VCFYMVYQFLVSHTRDCYLRDRYRGSESRILITDAMVDAYGIVDTPYKNTLLRVQVQSVA